MSHPKDTNYIIEVLADKWKKRKSFGSGGPKDQTGTYCIVDDQTTRKDYKTDHIFPAYILEICPTAPNASKKQIEKLILTQGAVGKAWKPVITFETDKT